MVHFKFTLDVKTSKHMKSNINTKGIINTHPQKQLRFKIDLDTKDRYLRYNSQPTNV